MRSPTALSLFALSFLVAPALAQLPDSPTGRGGNRLIELFGSSPETVTPDFLRSIFSEDFLATMPLNARVHWLQESIRQIGPLDLEGVRKTGPFSATIMGRSSLTDEQIEIRYQVAETAPHGIAELVIERGSSKPKQQLTREQMIAEADGFLDSLTQDRFSGTVLIAEGEEILLERAMGLASRRYSVPIHMDTLFNLGSINKIFTKIAIAQLAAAGKLSFADSVARHLPDYPDPEVAERITIQQVVTHSAGLGDIFTEEFARAAKDRFRHPKDYFPLFARQPLLFAPGTSQRYSNGGYMVLGAIVEAVSGQSYDEYVQQHIFEPAGMSSTGSFAMDDPVPDLAKGYTRQSPDPESPWRENSFLIPFTGTPAGGGYSKAADLLAFRHALVGHQLLDPRYTAWVVTDRLPDEAITDPGFAIGVAGGAPGVSAELEIDADFTIIVLSNLDPPSASEVALHLRELVASVD